MNLECCKHIRRRVVIIRETLQDNNFKLSFVDVAALSRSASDYYNEIMFFQYRQALRVVVSYGPIGDLRDLRDPMSCIIKMKFTGTL